jgi:NAD(P)-dependent dehydrogenase (short-subunit alcohol dehydrogenase family)
VSELERHGSGKCMRNSRLTAFLANLPDHAPKRGNKLRNHVAVVYGGGARDETLSVGQAAAYAYACAGAEVIVVDRDIDNAERTRELLVHGGADCMTLQADITDIGSVASVTEQVIAACGRIDVLHNNVGVPQVRDFASFETSDWLNGLQLNVLGAANTIRSALPHLLATGRGTVINISSIAAIRHTGMNYAIYSAAKAALNQLTVAVALEYAAQGLRANAILPGLLNTSMGRALAADEPPAQLSRALRSPTRFEGDPWDVANAAVFLASPEARYVNGHLLVVDGGLSARC